MGKRWRSGKRGASARAAKRKRSMGKSRVYRPMSKKKWFTQKRLHIAVKRSLIGMAETKEVLLNMATNLQVNHNSCVLINNNAFYSKLGLQGEQHLAADAGSRVGNKIFIRSISVSLHIEAQQYRPKTHWKLFLIRNRFVDTDITSSAQIYEGTNTNIMLDWIDTSKVDILFSKTFTLYMPNTGTALAANTGSGVVPDPPGTFDHESSSGAFWTVSTNPSWRGKFKVPINMNIQYADNQDTPARMRYQWVIQAYDNYAAPSSGALWSTYPLGHVSMTTKMQFKDI